MDESAEELFAELASRHAPEDLVPVEASIYTDFPEFSRKLIKVFQVLFSKYNTSKSGFLSRNELLVMMEKLDDHIEYLAIKALKHDEDGDSHISFREFLDMFRKAGLVARSFSNMELVLARLFEIGKDEDF